MCNCLYCLSDTCQGACTPAPSGYKTPWADTITDTVDTPCDCPADDYLTMLRVMAQEIDALERELDDVRDTFHLVLDHVKWDNIPESLVNDIDAIFDGNVDDDAE